MSEKKTLFRFDEGMPTGPDVALLVRTWPEPKPGDVFAYETVEKLLGLKCGSNRFRTVTTRWRKQMLRDKNVVIECRAEREFYVCNPDQVLGFTHGVATHIGRAAKVQRRKLLSIRPENDLQRSTAEWQARLMLMTEKEARKTRMNLLPSTEVKEQPKIAPPKTTER